MTSSLEQMVNEVIRLYLLSRNLATFTATNITTTDLNITNDTTITAGGNVILATATGSQIGTAANQLLGFHGATAVDQAAAIADAIDAAGAISQLNLLLAAMREKGLIAT